MVRQRSRAVVALGSLAAVTWLYAHVIHVTNGSIVALTFLLIVLVVASTSPLWVAVATALEASVALNFFFLPPVGTLTIEDPQNWVALFTFVAVCLIASNLSSAVRARERVAVERRDEVARLFDLSRDVLVMTDSGEAISGLAAVVAKRFDLDYVAVCLPNGADWDVFEAGKAEEPVDRAMLTSAFMASGPSQDLDVASRGYAHHRTMRLGAASVRLVPLHVGGKPVGLLGAAGRPVEGGTLDALGGVVAIAIERAHLLEARKAAALARQSEELKSALLASLGHDLRTPLTAIRVAASNLQASWLGPEDRLDQSGDRSDRSRSACRGCFRTSSTWRGSTPARSSAEQRWVHPAEIVGAARGSRAAGASGASGPGVDRRRRPRPRRSAPHGGSAVASSRECRAVPAPGAPIEVGATIAGDQVTLDRPRSWPGHYAR